MFPPRRIVMDVSGFVHQPSLTGVGRVELGTRASIRGYGERERPGNSIHGL